MDPVLAERIRKCGTDHVFLQRFDLTRAAEQNVVRPGFPVAGVTSLKSDDNTTVIAMNRPGSDPKFTLDAIPPAAGEGARMPLSTPGRTGRSMLAAFVILALVAGAVAVYFFWPRGVEAPQQVAPTPPAAAPAPKAGTEAAIEHPVEKIPGLAATDAGAAQFPLPRLDDSDRIARDAIETIVNSGAVRLLVGDGIIRRIVAAVDNLPRKTIAARVIPLKPVPGALATASTAQGMSIAADNAGRYAAYVTAAEAIDTKRLTGFYVRLYPLFQQAYVELGYPRGYFNDRLIAVIDHLLTAPEPKSPVYLSQPKVLFEFADQEMEELSAGQKILIRTGIDNELRLKGKLHEIRKALTARAANP